MSFRALLMRFFLIVALLANGPGIAGASMHMEHLRNSPGDVTDVTTAQTTAQALAACHGAAATPPPVADDHRHPQPIDQTGAVSPLGDCCDVGDCCACMHHCFAALAGSPLADVTLRYRQTAEPFRSVHASAALTNLFRPPIG